MLRQPPRYHLHVSPLRTHHVLILFVAALVVRLGWMTTWSRLVFDGHEALYRRAFMGSAPGPSTQMYAVLGTVYETLGRVTQDERALVVFSGVVGALGVVAAAVWVGRTIDATAGLWTGALVSVLPEHVAWSTSAYNVILPLTLLLWALALRGRWSFVLAAAAVSMRAELVLLAPLAGWPALLGGGAGLVALLLSGMTFPQADPMVLAFDINWALVAFLGPPVLLFSVMGLQTRSAWKLLVIAGWVHAVGSGFDDYGSRHALLGGVALCGLVGCVRTVWIPSLVVLVLGWETMQMASVWNAVDQGEVAMEAKDLGAPPRGCVEVTDEPAVQGQMLPSHVRFYRAELDVDCAVWGEEFWHRTWNSRGLMDRATRMRTLYSMEPIGAFRPKGGGPVRLYQRLERRW